MSLLNIDNGISLITTVCNREASLRRVLASWLGIINVSQIVIVDWSSTTSSEEYVRSLQSKKILYIYVENQRFFNIAQAKNLASQFSKYNSLLFLDADILLKDSFFLEHRVGEGCFYAGNWRIARSENEMHLNGQLYIQRSDFFEVNGYDERFNSYGWDDSDLYHRLEINKFILRYAKYLSFQIFWKVPLMGGLKRLNINPECLEHIPHEDQDRTINYPVTNVSPKDSIEENKVTSSLRVPWNRSFTQTPYQVIQSSASFYKLRKIIEE